MTDGHAPPMGKSTRRLMWTLSLLASIVAAMYGCGSDGGPAGSSGAAVVGGDASADGDAAAPGACNCATGHCQTVEDLCEFLEMTSCPTTVDELFTNWIQVGCGIRMVAQFAGSSAGYSYYFDEVTGELLGGVRYNDSPFGPCPCCSPGTGVSDYSFGQDFGSARHGLDCPDVVECGPLATDLSACLPGDGGDAALDGAAGD